MSRGSASTVDDYLASLTDLQRAALTRVIAAIRTGVPAATESISYRIPAFKVGGRAVIYCAAFREHYSVYPATAALIETLGDALSEADYNGKGTIRFRLDAPVPVRLIARIARLRAAEEAARAGTGARRTAARKR